jgi:hypothetical protein
MDVCLGGGNWLKVVEITIENSENLRMVDFDYGARTGDREIVVMIHRFAIIEII